MSEPSHIFGVGSRQVRASADYRKERKEHNDKEAKRLAREGYSVEQSTHENGAYFAHIGNHPEHEIEVGRIFAENGFAFTLDREGNTKIRINGRTYTLPSSDGTVEGFSHEIYALKGKPDTRKVVDAITHSRKAFVPDANKTIQSDIAISTAVKGSQYNRLHIANGVKEYQRRLNAGETKAKPLLYLHVDETNRKIYYWDIRRKGK